MGDRGGDFRERQYGEGTERETGDCGCRFVVTRAAESGPPLRSARWGMARISYGRAGLGEAGVGDADAGALGAPG